MPVFASARLIDNFLLGHGTDKAFVPWEIVVGTSFDCDTLRSALFTIEVALPFTAGDDTQALRNLPIGPMPIVVFNGDHVASPQAELQFFDGIDVDVLDAGTLTIESFGNVITGSFDGTGHGKTARAHGTFTADHCD